MVVLTARRVKTTRAQPDPSDEALESAWRSGSEDAFTALFRRHYPAVVAYAKRFTSDQAAAEDVVQQAFINVLQKRTSGSGRFKSLVYTVTRNLALNERRRRGRKYVASASLAEHDPAQAGAQSPLSGMVRDEEQAAFEAAVAALPGDVREAFCLKETRQLTHAEVGKIMGLHADAVRRRVAKGYALIRHHLRTRSLL